jgi:hypothetical protein
VQPVSSVFSIRCGWTIPEIQAGRGFQNQGVGARGLTVSLACTQVKWLRVKEKCGRVRRVRLPGRLLNDIWRLVQLFLAPWGCGVSVEHVISRQPLACAHGYDRKLRPCRIC